MEVLYLAVFSLSQFLCFLMPLATGKNEVMKPLSNRRGAVINDNEDLLTYEVDDL